MERELTIGAVALSSSFPALRVTVSLEIQPLFGCCIMDVCSLSLTALDLS